MLERLTRGQRQEEGPEESGNQRTPNRPSTEGSVTAIGFAALFSLLLLGAVPVALWGLKKAGVYPAEIALAIVLIAAAAALIIVVSMLSVVFNRLQISDSDEAMGLPSGSIRSIIALLLIVLFFISAIYLYSSVAQGPTPGPTRSLNGITAAQLATLPVGEIDRVATRTVNNAVVYDVILTGRLPDNQRADDIAAQLITIVATLVTAVAAFYFGANSVKTAATTTAAWVATGGPPSMVKEKLAKEAEEKKANEAEEKKANEAEEKKANEAEA
jgi:hypothetical protein